MAQGERRVGGLGQEHCRGRQIEAGAVEIEGIAGGDHQADHRLLAAKILELGDHPRQHRLRGGSAEDDQQLLLDVANELQHAKAAESADDSEHP